MSKFSTRRLFAFVGCFVVGFSLASILIVWVSWFWYGPALSRLLGFSQQSNASVSGAIGDSFGALTSLFSLIGTSAIIITLWVQFKALRVAQRDAYIQRFEEFFFQTVNRLRDTREDVSFQYSRNYRLTHGKGGKTFSGIHAFRAAARDYNHFLSISGRSDKFSEVQLGRLYTILVHRRFESTFSVYFRTVYFILDRIKSDGRLASEEKINLSNFLRGQMTTHEVYLLALNALTDDAKDLKDLIIHFRILKYIPAGTRRDLLRRVYPAEAFLGRS